MKKRIFILMIFVVLFIFGCNKKQPVVTEDGRTIITFVSKDLNPSDPDSVKYIEAIEEGLAKQGVHIKIQLVEMPSSGYTSKLTLMLISGKVPDIIYFQGGGDTVMGEQGLLVDLLPLVNESEIFQERMPIHNRKRLENFPYLLRVSQPSSKVPVMRSDWLDELDLDPPETVEEYYHLMKKISESDLDGNGRLDTYGIGTTENTERLDFIFDKAFGITSTWILDEEGNYVYSRVTEFEKNKLAFYRKLFEEKILDNEYITTKWDSYEDKFYNGKMGIAMATNGTVVDIYENKMRTINGDNVDLIPFDPPKGVDQGFQAIDVTKEERGYAISAVSEHKEIAFKVLEFMLSDDGMMLDRVGLEGEQYNIVDGEVVLTPKSKEWYSRFFNTSEWEPPVPLFGDAAIESEKIVEQYSSEDINFIIPRELATTWDALTTMYKEYSYKIISGEYPISKFDEFVKEWYQEGGKKITEYANIVLKENSNN